MGMAEDDCAVARQQVDVFVVVNIPDPGSLSPFEEDWEGVVGVDPDVG